MLFGMRVRGFVVVASVPEVSCLRLLILFRVGLEGLRTSVRVEGSLHRKTFYSRDSVRQGLKDKRLLLSSNAVTFATPALTTSLRH